MVVFPASRSSISVLSSLFHVVLLLYSADLRIELSPALAPIYTNEFPVYNGGSHLAIYCGHSGQQVSSYVEQRRAGGWHIGPSSAHYDGPSWDGP